MFDTVIWCVFNGASAVLQIVTLCASLKLRFNKYAVFFCACIPFTALALSQRFVQVIAPSVTAVAGIVWFFIAVLLFFKDKLRTRIFVSIMIFAIAAIMSLAFFRRFEGIGWGTLVIASINGTIIGFFCRLFDKYFDFTPLFKKFAAHFELEKKQ